MTNSETLKVGVEVDWKLVDKIKACQSLLKEEEEMAKISRLFQVRQASIISKMNGYIYQLDKTLDDAINNATN